MPQLSPSQQVTWEILTQDPARFAHQWGAMLTQSDSHELHSRFDAILLEIMRYSAEDACRVIKTLLCHYQIPVDVARLENFDVFHSRHKNYVMANCKNIKEFERRDPWNDKP